jgi:WD40 repeat protein
VRIWHLQGDTPCVILKGHSSEVNAIAFSPDGRQLVSGSNDKTLRIWDVNSGTAVLVLEDHCEICSVAWSPNEWLIASGGVNWDVNLWYSPSGAGIRGLRSPDGHVSGLAFVPETKHLAVSTGKTMYLAN